MVTFFKYKPVDRAGLNGAETGAAAGTTGDNGAVLGRVLAGEIGALTLENGFGVEKLPDA